MNIVISSKAIICFYMACNNPKCNCTNCVNDKCPCDGTVECACQPELASCCCDK